MIHHNVYSAKIFTASQAGFKQQRQEFIKHKILKRSEPYNGDINTYLLWLTAGSVSALMYIKQFVLCN